MVRKILKINFEIKIVTVKMLNKPLVPTHVLTKTLHLPG